MLLSFAQGAKKKNQRARGQREGTHNASVSVTTTDCNCVSEEGKTSINEGAGGRVFCKQHPGIPVVIHKSEFPPH